MADVEEHSPSTSATQRTGWRTAAEVVATVLVVWGGSWLAIRAAGPEPGIQVGGAVAWPLQDGPAGMLDAVWTMTPAELKAARPAARESGLHALVEDREAFGRPAQVTYSFHPGSGGMASVIGPVPLD